MNEYINILFVFAGGTVAGMLFFGGLWLTVTKGLTSKKAGLWLVTSFILRMGMILTAFYFLGAGDWKKILACLAGFVIARMLTIRYIRTARDNFIQIKKGNES